jgi:hypothetical protein
LGFLTVAHVILYFAAVGASKRVARWKVKEKTPINYSKI